MIVFILLLAVQENEIFKNAVEQYQKMEGEWLVEELHNGGSIRLMRPMGVRLVVSDYDFMRIHERPGAKYNPVAWYKCVGFDSKLNAFRICTPKGCKSGKGLIGFHKGNLIMVILVGSKSIDSLEPTGRSHVYWVFRR